MQQSISVISKEELKQAVREVLDESTQKAAAPQPEQYLHGLKQLADFIGVSEVSAWRLKKSGKIPFYQAGKKLFFKQSDVLQSLSK
jgi:hypothetical protein